MKYRFETLEDACLFKPCCPCGLPRSNKAVLRCNGSW